MGGKGELLLFQRCFHPLKSGQSPKDRQNHSPEATLNQYKPRAKCVADTGIFLMKSALGFRELGQQSPRCAQSFCYNLGKETEIARTLAKRGRRGSPQLSQLQEALQGRWMDRVLTHTLSG